VVIFFPLSKSFTLGMSSLIVSDVALRGESSTRKSTFPLDVVNGTVNGVQRTQLSMLFVTRTDERMCF